MSLSAEMQALFATPEAPALGPGPRAGVASIDEIEAKLRKGAVAGRRKNLVRALVLLWHDRLDAAHEIVQDLENADGSYIHAILHRREPDYSNAKYWFRRVGRHACFIELARRVGSLLEAEADGALRARLLPQGQWDSFQFVDLCESVAGKARDGLAARLRRVQQIEFVVFLEYLLEAN